MANQRVDLVVIGGGSGGVRAARIAAQLGANVALVESRYLGGTCVNVGCVPKKLLHLSAKSGDWVQHDLGAYGWRVENSSFDWSVLRDNVAAEVARLNSVYASMLDTHDVTVVEGHGTLIGPNVVAVGDRQIEAERILVATGGTPFLPEWPGSEHCITSDAVFSLEHFPESLVVVGSGYIGVEMACIFNQLGSRVHLLVRGDYPLRGFDDDVRVHLADEMRKDGVMIHEHCHVARVERDQSGGHRAHLVSGEPLVADQVLVATGRVPNTQGLGLETVNVDVNERGAVVVNDQFQSSVPSVYAVGDLIDRVALTPVAIQEGMALAKSWYGNEPIGFEYCDIPSAVFSSPNVGTVGLTESQAREQGHDIEVKKSEFRGMPYVLSKRDRKSLLKLVLEKNTGKILGMHMVGDEAGEIIQGFAVAVKMGATLADFHRTVGIHPTVAEEWVTMR